MNTIVIKKKSIKTQALAALIATVAAVALPQVFHVMGLVSGLGSALGETFLPMHLPVMAVGLMSGPLAGATTGFLAPLVSFSLTSMPALSFLPFMMIELAVYGLAAGLLQNAKIPVTFKVLLTQIAGRAIRALAILLSFYVFSNSAIRPEIIVKSIAVGIFGIVLQLTLIPLFVYRVENIKKNEN
ncbi:MAG: ECF transporter S component [Acutalibacteraceae bacterium]|jgi:hypothetical protein